MVGFRSCTRPGVAHTAFYKKTAGWIHPERGCVLFVFVYDDGGGDITVVDFSEGLAFLLPFGLYDTPMLKEKMASNQPDDQRTSTTRPKCMMLLTRRPPVFNSNPLQSYHQSHVHSH